MATSVLVGAAGASCNDWVLNGDEADIDCGGAVCASCEAGSSCTSHLDCQSQVCRAGSCQASSCADGRLNGGESDLDCGGTCQGCEPGMGCAADSDCASGELPESRQPVRDRRWKGRGRAHAARMLRASPAMGGGPWYLAPGLMQWFGGSVLGGVLVAAAVAACGGQTARDFGGAASRASGGGPSVDGEAGGEAGVVVAGAGGRVGVAGGAGGEFPNCGPPLDPRSGTLIWARRAGGPDSDGVGELAVGPDDRIVVVGSFGEEATFGENGPNQVTLQALGAGDGFVAHYAPDGRFESIDQVGGSYQQSSDGISDVAFTPDGGMLLAGNFIDSVTLGAGSSGEVGLTSVGRSNAFVARFDSAGAVDWVTQAGGDDSDWIHDLVATDDSIVVSGSFQGNVTLALDDPDRATLLPLEGGYRDVYIARYALDGSLVWARQGGSTFVDNATDVAACPDGSAYLAGVTFFDMVFNPGQPSELALVSNGYRDGFVAKYDRDGQLEWATQLGGDDSDEVQAIATLPDCSLLLTGYFSETAVFGAGEPNEIRVTATGLHDGFLARYAPDGRLSWFRRIAGRATGTALATMADGSVFVGGRFADGVTLAPGECNETRVSTEGDTGIFLARYTEAGDLAWVRGMVSEGSDSVRSLVPHSDGTLLLAGTLNGDLVLGAGEANETHLESAGEADVLIARFRQ